MTSPSPAIKILRFGTPGELAAEAARQWVDLLRANPAIGTALPGGRIAGEFFRSAAARIRGESIDLGQAHFFWGDERCVGPTDPDSNFKLANDGFLRELGVAASRIHRVRGELSPDAAAEEASRDLMAWSKTTSGGQPVLDLILLGMGEDGHVASLFPSASPEVVASHRVYLAVTGPKPPPRRVSLSYRALEAARNVWVLASGAGKQAALEASLESGRKTPLGRVLEARRQTTIFTDIVG